MGSLGHLNPKGFDLLFLEDLIHIASVLVQLIFIPERIQLLSFAHCSNLVSSLPNEIFFYIWVLSYWNCQYLCSENKQIGKERVTLSYTSLKTEIIRRKTIVDYLVSFGLSTLYDRRKYQCIKLFNSISSDQHKLACLPPPKHQGYLPGMPRFRTNCLKNSSYQPCAVVQTCYYNVRLCVIKLFFFFFFSFFYYHYS